jgi:hypothetical protein
MRPSILERILLWKLGEEATNKTTVHSNYIINNYMYNFVYELKYVVSKLSK